MPDSRDLDVRADGAQQHAALVSDMGDTRTETARATPGRDRYRLYVEVEIDSTDEPSMAILLDMARQLVDGLKESDAYPDLMDATQEGHAVYFVAHGVDRLRAQPGNSDEASNA